MPSLNDLNREWVVFVEDQTVNVSTVAWREQTTFWWNVMIIIMSTLYQWSQWILFWTIPEHANSIHVSLHSDTYPDPEPNIYKKCIWIVFFQLYWYNMVGFFVDKFNILPCTRLFESYMSLIDKLGKTVNHGRLRASVCIIFYHGNSVYKLPLVTV